MGSAKTELQLELPLAGAAAAAPGGQFSLQFEEPALPFRLRRSSRDTVAFTVDEQGLKVRAPRGLSLSQIEQALRSRSKAISEKLAGRRSLGVTIQRWHDGVRFPYLGRMIALRLEADGHEAALRGDELLLPLPPEADDRQIRDRAHAWLQAEAKRVLGSRVDACARRLGLMPPPWQLSFAAGSWGAVDEECRLRLAWRLIHLSPAEIDGVVAKQLSRLPRQTGMSDLWTNVELPA